jgi:hypothetical protein
MRHFKVVPALIVAGALMFAAAPSQASPLSSNCTKYQGTVTCTTFDGPGNNQGGVGTTTSDETQGNTSNTSPEPQDLQSGQTCKPPKSQGTPCP